MMPYLSCKKIENDVYNFPTWQYCKYKDIFDSRIIINSTAKFYISISYQKDLLSIDTRIFTPSVYKKRKQTIALTSSTFLYCYQLYFFQTSLAILSYMIITNFPLLIYIYSFFSNIKISRNYRKTIQTLFFQIPSMLQKSHRI